MTRRERGRKKSRLAAIRWSLCLFILLRGRRLVANKMQRDNKGSFALVVSPQPLCSFIKTLYTSLQPYTTPFILFMMMNPRPADPRCYMWSNHIHISINYEGIQIESGSFKTGSMLRPILRWRKCHNWCNIGINLWWKCWIKREDKFKSKKHSCFICSYRLQNRYAHTSRFVSCANSFDAHSRHCSDFQVRFKRYLIGGKEYTLTNETKEKKEKCSKTNMCDDIKFLWLPYKNIQNGLFFSFTFQPGGRLKWEKWSDFWTTAMLWIVAPRHIRGRKRREDNWTIVTSHQFKGDMLIRLFLNQVLFHL